MPPRIRLVLSRLRDDISACITPAAIADACRAADHRWRDRALNPITTVYLFLLQILHGNTACHHVVHFGIWKFTESAYCQARKRLPLAVLETLLQSVTAKVQQTTRSSSLWLERHRVWIVDGSSFSMPDEEELQRHFGQSTGQRAGCGFPVAKIPGTQCQIRPRTKFEEATWSASSRTAVRHSTYLRRFFRAHQTIQPDSVRD